MITDLVSLDQFGDAMNEPGAESPPRPTVDHADKFSDQFQGLAGPDGSEPPAGRHPHYVGGENGPSLHEYRESLDGGFGKAKHAS